MRDLGELTETGRFVYVRLTMADDEREQGDPVRRGQYDPCCLEHYRHLVCVLPYGHEPITELERTRMALESLGAI